MPNRLQGKVSLTDAAIIDETLSLSGLDKPQDTISAKTYERLGMASLSLNTPEEEILANVRANIRRHLPQAKPHAPNDQRMCIVGGGWSLEETFDELRELYWQGAKVVTVNGSARWCIERNIKPSAHVVMDARESNRRFVELPEVPGLKYFLASQCHPSLFDAIEGREAYIWHACSFVEPEKEILNEYYLKNWTAIPGTTCVGFRALCLMRLLGFQWFDVFGLDSCYAPDGRHHAYAQAENEGENTAIVTCAGREFRVSGWQISQATHFRELVQSQGDKFHINFHGDGLIAHSVRTAAGIKEN